MRSFSRDSLEYDRCDETCNGRSFHRLDLAPLTLISAFVLIKSLTCKSLTISIFGSAEYRDKEDRVCSLSEGDTRTEQADKDTYMVSLLSKQFSDQSHVMFQDLQTYYELCVLLVELLWSQSRQTHNALQILYQVIRPYCSSFSKHF